MLRTARSITVLMTALAAFMSVPANAVAEPAVALDGTQLTFFDTATPGTFLTRSIAGLPSTVTSPVKAMDVRPADGQLYVITMTDSGALDDTAGQLWKIDLVTAVATPVGAAFSSTLTDNAFWGMDFSPTADRIRLVENDANSYRINPDTGALVVQDTDLNPGGADIGDIAYDRSFTGAPASTAYAVDFTTDRLYRLGGVDGTPSANGGLLTDLGPLSIGITNAANFDISPSSGIAYLSQGVGLYTVDLATGASPVLAAITFPASDGVALLGTSSIGVASAAVAATEAAGTAPVTVTRTGVMNVAATVDFATADGTAVAGTDYASVTGTLTFAPGQTSKTIQVPIVQDSAIDDGETFTLTLSNVAGRATAATAVTSTVTIGDEDVADVTKPAVLLPALGARSFALLRRDGVVARFSTSETSSSRPTLRLGTRIVGIGSLVTLPRAGVSTVRVRLSTTGQIVVRNALRASRSGRVALTLTLVTTDPAGNRRSTVARVFVVR